MHKILELLAHNVRSNTRPDFVDSMFIAGELNMSVQETKQLLRSMHAMGTVESSMDCEYSLITYKGMELCQ
ncbi:hypothetical protein [Desulfogranum japonicum]|uniref:hypothetical protein n=1 Tax=Desulfogranum japonicum TaxID=231447 RepID=UPI001378D41C|nr:hypothetical protein [Desulfogranum japonicum]